MFPTPTEGAQNEEQNTMLAKNHVAILCAIGAAWTIASARADVIYTYTGNNFTIVSSPYTTSDHVTASLTFATALPANLPLRTSEIPIAYSFNDGVQTINSINEPISTVFALLVLVSTDAAGAIKQWQVGVETTGPNGPFIGSDNDISASVILDSGALGNLSTQPFAESINSPGTWTVTTASSVPEPSSAGLTALALTVLGWIRTRYSVRIPRRFTRLSKVGS
jgi:hypothetical protein